MLRLNSSKLYANFKWKADLRIKYQRKTGPHSYSRQTLHLFTMSIGFTPEYYVINIWPDVYIDCHVRNEHKRYVAMQECEASSFTLME